MNKNIQMKHKNASTWDNLYPVSLTSNIFDGEGKSVDTLISELNAKFNGEIVYAKDFGVVGNGVADDTVKLQNAIDYCLSFANAKALVVTSMCKITAPLIINRAVDTTNNEFKIIGVGASGILVDSAINIFDSTIAGTTYPVSEHVTFEGLRFECSQNTLNANVITSKFLRVKFLDCFFYKIKCITSTIYLQSYYFDSKCNARMWKGYFISMPSFFDVNFIGMTFEFGEYVMTSVGSGSGGHGLNFIGCLIESCYSVFTGSGLHGAVFEGNYTEGNAYASYDFTAGYTNYGISFKGNTLHASTANKANASFYEVVLGVTYGFSGGGNYSDYKLYDISTTPATVNLINDYAVTELFKGNSTGVSSTTRNVVAGSALITEGKKLILNNSNNYMGFEAGLGTVMFGGINNYNSADISGERVPVKIGFGLTSPQTAPADYGNISWCKGSIIYNLAPAVGQPKGWVCTASGTYATAVWVSLGNL